MRVVVIGDVAHVVVVGPVATTELGVRDDTQCGEKPFLHLFGRRVIVGSPHHHRHKADLTVGDPTVIIGKVTSGDDGCFAEIAVAHLTVSSTDESFFNLVPAMGFSETTFVHVGFGPAPGPVVV